MEQREAAVVVERRRGGVYVSVYMWGRVLWCVKGYGMAAVWGSGVCVCDCIWEG